MTRPPQPTGKNPKSEHPQLRQHSQNVWEYQPQAVVAPNGSPPSVHSGEQLRKVMAAEQYAHTLLYDLFRTLDGKKVIAIQADEFAEHFGTLAFSHRGRKLHAQQRQDAIIESPRPNIRPYGIILWEIRLPSSTRNTSARLTIRTGSGVHLEVDVPLNPFADWQRTELFQQTMIKDHPFSLVRDHCLFHHRAHGFNRMMIYDNGSANYAEQLDALGTLDPNLQIVVANWPFPWFRQAHMKHTGNIHDTLSQVAGFNHGLNILGHLSRFGTHLDMDEYLYNASGMPLSKLMAQQTRMVPYRTMASYRIPAITSMNHREYFNAADFQHMPRPPHKWKDLFRHNKYFYRMGRSSLGMQLEHIRIHTPYIKRTLASRCRALLITLFGYRRIFGKSKASPALIRIYHYTGMGPNWHAEKGIKMDPARWELQPPDPHKHIRFTEIAQLMASIGLDKPQGEHP